MNKFKSFSWFHLKEKCVRVKFCAPFCYSERFEEKNEMSNWMKNKSNRQRQRAKANEPLTRVFSLVVLVFTWRKKKQAIWLKITLKISLAHNTFVYICLYVRARNVLESRICRPPGRHISSSKMVGNDGNNAQKSSSHVHIVSAIVWNDAEYTHNANYIISFMFMIWPATKHCLKNEFIFW